MQSARGKSAHLRGVISKNSQVHDISMNTALACALGKSQYLMVESRTLQVGGLTCDQVSRVKLKGGGR